MEPNNMEGGYCIVTRNGVEMPDPGLGEYLPTPEEIARMCLEIREGWSTDERRKRKGNTNRPSAARVFRLAMMRR